MLSPTTERINVLELYRLQSASSQRGCKSQNVHCKTLHLPPTELIPPRRGFPSPATSHTRSLSKGFPLRVFVPDRGPPPVLMTGLFMNVSKP